MTRQEKLRHVTRLRDFHLQIQRYRSVIPAKAGRSAQRGEHPKDGPEGVSEANHPVPWALCKSLDPNFRWDDEHLAIPARRSDAFLGQQWATQFIFCRSASAKPSFLCKQGRSTSVDISGAYPNLHSTRMRALHCFCCDTV